MTETASLLRFGADFGEAALDGQLSVFRGDAELVVGQRVELSDDEDNRRIGVVTELDKHVAWVELILRPSERCGRSI